MTFLRHSSLILILAALASIRSQPLTAADPVPSATVAPDAYPEASRRVALPYRFTRRGVEVHFNSIELVDSQVRVNVTLKEIQNQSAELRVTTLVSVETPNGQSFT